MKRTVLMLLVLTESLFAAHPLATDDPGTVAPRRTELEINYDNAAGEPESRVHSTGVSVKHGLTGWLDAGVSLPAALSSAQDAGTDTVSWGVKINPVKDLFALTVSNDIGSRAYFFNGVVALPVEKGRAHFNAGYRYGGGRDAPNGAVYRLAGERGVGRADIVAEICHDGSVFSDWLAGVRYRLGGTCFVDAGAGRDLAGDADRLTLGFHTEF